LNYDTGFRSNPDGYQFINPSVQDISWDLFRNTYGVDEVEINGQPTRRARNFYGSLRTIASEGSCFGMAASSLVLHQNSLRGWDLAGQRTTFLGEVINPGQNRPLDFADNYLDTNLNRQYDQGEIIVLDYNNNGVWDQAPRTWGIFPQFLFTPLDWVEYYHIRQLDAASKADEQTYLIMVY
jgi:hypothetical protein